MKANPSCPSPTLTFSKSIDNSVTIQSSCKLTNIEVNFMVPIGQTVYEQSYRSKTIPQSPIAVTSDGKYVVVNAKLSQLGTFVFDNPEKFDLMKTIRNIQTDIQHIDLVWFSELVKEKVDEIIREIEMLKDTVKGNINNLK